MSPTTTGAEIALTRQGLVDYQIALDAQRRIHEEVVAGTRVSTLILLEHPSVYTAGRRTEAHERPLDGTPVVDVDRGGKITWHGEGQLVGYPIIRLKNRNEVVGFVREIEAALIKVCEEFGIAGEQYCDRSGVWLRDEKGDRKIAAIGIRVAKGVTMHGFALNVCPDMSGFDRIVPCGLKDTSVTSMAIELGRTISIDEVLPVVEKYMFEALSKVAEFTTI